MMRSIREWNDPRSVQPSEHGSDWDPICEFHKGQGLHALVVEQVNYARSVTHSYSRLTGLCGRHVALAAAVY
jgi:hypothetical protein